MGKVRLSSRIFCARLTQNAVSMSDEYKVSQLWATNSFWNHRQDPSCEADYWSSQLLRVRRIEIKVWINPILSGRRRLRRNLLSISGTTKYHIRILNLNKQANTGYYMVIFIDVSYLFLFSWVVLIFNSTGEYHLLSTFVSRFKPSDSIRDLNCNFGKYHPMNS